MGRSVSRLYGEMLSMIAADFVVVLVMTSMWWMTCQGHTEVDVERDFDDIWPVLCPSNTYYSKKQELCLACSQCPANKIIITHCHGLHNTKCGPFFNLIGLISPQASPPAKDTLSESPDPVSHITHHNSKHTVSYLDSSKSTLELTDSEWKFVTICLSVFLSLAVVVIFVVVVCLFRRKDTSENRFQCKHSPPVEDV